MSRFRLFFTSYSSRIAHLAVALMLMVLVVHQVSVVGDFRVDDAYITFSFSKNLASGNGPIYSHGVRVEGYSNFLWMVIGALPWLIAPNADPYIGIRVICALFLLGGLWSTYRLARMFDGPWSGALAVALVLCSSDVTRAWLSGLETVPFMSAIAFGWLIYFREPPSQRRWSLVAFLPAALLRIDGFVPMLAVIAFEIADSIVERRFSIKRLALWAAPAVSVWLLYFVWRWSYYGLPLPSTYYAKELVAAKEPGRGINQLWAFCRDYGLIALLPLMVSPLYGVRRRAGVALAGAVTAQLWYATRTGGDWMPFNRFFLPILPLGAVLCVWGILRVRDELRPFNLEVRVAGATVVLLLLTLYGVHAHAGMVNTKEEREKLNDARHVASHTKDGLLGSVDLLEHVIRRPGDKLATDYAGVFAVFTDAALIDMWGLCNADIARKGGIEDINPIYGKECAKCYRDLQPDYFHIEAPLVRKMKEFRNVRQLIQAVFQGPAIDREIDIRTHFAAGRVIETASGRTLWFLERRREELPLVPRTPAVGVLVDYPFEER